MIGGLLVLQELNYFECQFLWCMDLCLFVCLSHVHRCIQVVVDNL